MTRIWIVLPFLLVVLSSGASLAVMAGYRFWPEPALQADLEFHEFRLPANYEVDPTEISDELSSVLSARALGDFAIRALMGSQGQTQVADLVVPRLLNSGVIRRLIADMDTLGTVISVAEFKGQATGRVTNRSDVEMEDVAIILPGVVHAELPDGLRLSISEPVVGLQSIDFGSLASGQTVSFTAWFNIVPDPASAAFADAVRLGASDGIDGRVSIHGRQSWFGRTLEVVSWARWTVSGILLLAFVGAFVALGYQLVGLLQSGRRQS